RRARSQVRLSLLDEPHDDERLEEARQVAGRAVLAEDLARGARPRPDELEDGAELDLGGVAVDPDHLADRGDLARAVGEAALLDDDVHGRGDLIADRAEREVDA